jgi:hypothetical protein
MSHLAPCNSDTRTTAPADRAGKITALAAAMAHVRPGAMVTRKPDGSAETMGSFIRSVQAAGRCRA